VLVHLAGMTICREDTSHSINKRIFINLVLSMH
jgi:hypothetical protein